MHREHSSELHIRGYSVSDIIALDQHSRYQKGLVVYETGYWPTFLIILYKHRNLNTQNNSLDPTGL